ncbi:hypothetical protein D3C73_1399870 [compost metagenome]
MRQRRLGTDHGGTHIHLVETIPGQQVAALDGLPGKTAGHVDQTINAAPLRGDLLERSTGRLGRRQVDTAQAQQVFRVQQGGRRLAAIQQGNPGASRQQECAECAAEGSKPAGDDYPLVQ